ncbi:MAG TPA: hypothetical protein DEA52_06860 [Clostridiaceae bacterium]|nr:hypothetical protein [Clostridiaceae bacterium]
MKKINTFFSIMMATVLVLFMTGCTLGNGEDLSSYMDPVEENREDKVALMEYVEELRPLLESYYEGTGALKSFQGKGNEILMEIDLQELTSAYEKVEEHMIYEATRITHGILNYRPWSVATEIYRISITFTGEKTVVFYGGQMKEKEGDFYFSAETILQAVKRKD